MNTIKMTLAAVLVVVSSVGLAAESSSDAARQQRMDAALQNYQDTHANTTPGPMARAEESTKRGARKTGSAIKHGAQKAGHAIENGARNTRDAVRRTGEKMGGSSKE